MKTYMIIVICCAAAALLLTLAKARSLGRLLSSSFSGVVGLLALNMLPAFSGVITANLFSLCVCAVFGVSCRRGACGEGRHSLYRCECGKFVLWGDDLRGADGVRKGDFGRRAGV